jgi:dolichyl-phosphate beta-glucosyltransferase
VVVDDGSRDATVAVAARAAEADPRIVLLQNERNQGKGASVRRGMLAARGAHIFFMDADLSVPIEELDDAYEGMIREDAAILIGSRRMKGARIEQRQPFLRECMGDAFTTITRLLLAPRIHDFTCGFKGFRRREARRLFSLQQCDDWSFDAEVLYLARLLDIPVRQRPVRWRHGPDSKVRFPRDIIRTVSGLVRIRMHAPAQARRARAAGAPEVDLAGVSVGRDLSSDRDALP